MGATYALLAVGYTLVFGVMRLLTLAHGMVLMAAGFLMLVVTEAAGASIWAALVIAVVIGAVLSMLTDVVSFRPVGYGRPISAAVSTIGFGLVIREVIVQLLEGNVSRGPSYTTPELDFRVADTVVDGVDIITLLIAVAVAGVGHWFVQRTRWGASMRAFSHDPEAVRLLGIPVRRVVLLTLAMAGALAGLAAFLTVWSTGGGVSPDLGFDLTLIGLVAMTIGGIGSIPGALVAGVGLGVASQLLAYRAPAGFQEAVPWVLVIIALTVRPRGLFRGMT